MRAHSVAKSHSIALSIAPPIEKQCKFAADLKFKIFTEYNFVKTSHWPIRF